MADTPDRIWITGSRNNGSWNSTKTPADWALTSETEYIRADVAEAEKQLAVAAALREAAKVMGDYHWHRYASREEGGQLSRPAVFTSHTHQAAQELILALIPDAGAALDRALAAQRERDAKVAETHPMRFAGQTEDDVRAALAAAIRAQRET